MSSDPPPPAASAPTASASASGQGHLPPNPSDDTSTVAAALAKLQTLRKLSMSSAGGFTPINRDRDASGGSVPGSAGAGAGAGLSRRTSSARSSAMSSKVPSAAPSQHTSPNLQPNNPNTNTNLNTTTTNPPNLNILSPTPGPGSTALPIDPNNRNEYPFAAYDDPSLNISTPAPIHSRANSASILTSPNLGPTNPTNTNPNPNPAAPGSGAGAGSGAQSPSYLTQGANGGQGSGTGLIGSTLTPEEARALSAPGTPHFGAQGDMLKTLDESTQILLQSRIKQQQAARSSDPTLAQDLHSTYGPGESTKSPSTISASNAHANAMENPLITQLRTTDLPKTGAGTGGVPSGMATPSASVSGIGTLVEKPDYSEAKIVVAMVGLPARGKSYLSNKLMRYLRWLEYKVEVFNVGQLRRRKARDLAQAGKAPEDHSSNYFSSQNAEASALREQLATESLETLITWLKEGGNVGIHDATNSTKARRKKIAERISKEPGFQVIFLESWCDDPEIISQNVALKARSGDPDYAGKSKEDAERDFRARIAEYERVYETLDEQHLTWCKVMNVGKTVKLNQINGYLQSRIAFYLMNLHLKPRSIYLSRHGESMHNVGGMIGGDSPLSPRGEMYGSALPQLVKDNIGDKALQVWTSTLQRTIATARHMPYPKKTWRSLDELDAGVCDGMTYEEIAEKYPEDYAARDDDKYDYRYRGGESYRDVVNRLEPVILEIERTDNVLVICHQAIIRCLYGYFMGLSKDEIPYIKVPLHAIMELRPMAYGCEEQRYKVPIEAVDTHRPKPKRSATNDKPEGLPTSTTARDYYGNKTTTGEPAAPVEETTPLQKEVEDIQHKETPKSPQKHASELPRSPTSPKITNEERARHNMILQQVEEDGLRPDAELAKADDFSQEDIMRALAAQRDGRGKPSAGSVFKYKDFIASGGKDRLYSPNATPDGKRFNRHKLVCPRKGCGSTILLAGAADLDILEGDILPEDPAAPFDPEPTDDSEPSKSLSKPTPYWHVPGGPMAFENIGYSREDPKNKERKWLVCAECDLGPLGWAQGQESWLSAGRVAYH